MQAKLKSNTFFTFAGSSKSHNLLSLCCLSSLSNPISVPAVSSPRSSSASQWFSLLRAAITTSELTTGKCIHARILTSVENPERFLINNLISMYWKCGSLAYARRLFDKTSERDLVTWNSILAAYAQSSQDNIENIQEGFRLFRLLRLNIVSISRMTLAFALNLCLQSGYLWASEVVHGYAVKIGLECDEFVSGSLVNIYSKFGRINNARVLFEWMPKRDVVSWNVMLKAYLKTGLLDEALGLFCAFRRSGLHPDEVTLGCMLSRLSGVDSIVKKRLQQIQGYALKLFSYDDDDGSCGGGDGNSNVILWNKKLSKHSRAGESLAVIHCFLIMVRSNVGFDNVTFVVLLSAAAGIDDLGLGHQIHGMALKVGLDSVLAVANCLINMYSKMSCIGFAREVFHGMAEQDLISWNSMISACSQDGLAKEAVDLFISLLRSGLAPDHFTLASVLKACPCLSEGLFFNKQVHAHAVKTNNVVDKFVLTALIDAYCRNGSMEKAEDLFVKTSQFDLATWNAMMFGYTLSNQSHETLKLFAVMHRSGKRSDQITLATAAKACASLPMPEQGKQIHAHVIKSGFESDLWTSSGILDIYAKCGNMESAHLAFDNIDSPDKVAWTSIISRCIENGKEDCVFTIYCQMRLSSVLPDEYTVANLVKACSRLAALEQGRQIHTDTIKLNCAADPFVGTSLVDMYAKCGNIKDAFSLFKRIETKNIATWNALLVGLAQNGNGEEALKLFRLMESQGIKPDRVTLIAILTACSHSRLVSEAFEYFQSMQRDYGINPEIGHYSCLVHALGHAGHIQEAEKLIKSMPFEACAFLYEALLGACRVQGDIETGKRVAARLIALKPSDSSTYALLSNLYAAANKWDDMKETRRMMKRKNVKKDPAFSWVNVKQEENP